MSQIRSRCGAARKHDSPYMLGTPQTCLVLPLWGRQCLNPMMLSLLLCAQPLGRSTCRSCYCSQKSQEGAKNSKALSPARNNGAQAQSFFHSFPRARATLTVAPSPTATVVSLREPMWLLPRTASVVGVRSGEGRKRGLAAGGFCENRRWARSEPDMTEPGSRLRPPEAEPRSSLPHHWDGS